MSEKEKFNCGHPNTQSNRYKLGSGRVGCRICRKAWTAKHPDVRVRDRKNEAQRIEADVEVEAERVPGRLALRRFSWEDDPSDGPWSGSKR